MANDLATIFRGLRKWVEPSGRVRLEGTVAVASRVIGLSPRRVREFIDDGRIAARAPGDDGSGQLDSAGRPKAYKKLVDFGDVLTMAYGRAEAERLLKALGVDDVGRN